MQLRAHTSAFIELCVFFWPGFIPRGQGSRSRLKIRRSRWRICRYLGVAGLKDIVDYCGRGEVGKEPGQVVEGGPGGLQRGFTVQWRSLVIRVGTVQYDSSV